MKVILIFLLMMPTLSYAAGEKIPAKLLYTDKHEQLIVRDLSSGKESKLKTTARSPKWSHDGEKILFYSLGHNEQNEEIYITDKIGKKRTRITNSPPGVYARYPKWGGNDGIVYYNLESVGKSVLQQLNLKQPKKQPVTVDLKTYLHRASQEDTEQIRFYPSYDSHFALLTSEHPYELHLVDLLNKSVIAKIPFSDGFSDAGWSKDSKQVAIGTGSFNETKLVIINIDGTYNVLAYEKPEEMGCGSYSWSKDKHYIAMDCREPFSEDEDAWIYILDLERSQTKKLMRGANPDLY